jgi:hypothetical protein
MPYHSTPCERPPKDTPCHKPLPHNKLKCVHCSGDRLSSQQVNWWKFEVTSLLKSYIILTKLFKVNSTIRRTMLKNQLIITKNIKYAARAANPRAADRLAGDWPPAGRINMTPWQPSTIQLASAWSWNSPEINSFSAVSYDFLASFHFPKSIYQIKITLQNLVKNSAKHVYVQ